MKIPRLILLAAVPLSLVAQTSPSKEYVRLGSRVVAIEAPPTLMPSGDPNAANEGEPTTTITITGSPSSSWSATSNGGLITITSQTSGMTNSTGVATITYSLAGNTQPTLFAGYILVTMESGTAVYNISQLCCWADSITLSPTNAPAPAKASSGSVSVGTSSNNVSWSVSAQSCFKSVSPASGTGALLINYSLLANTSTTQQTCSFTVTASGGGNSQTFTVTQAGAPGLSETNPNVTLTGSGTYAVSVPADGLYTVYVLNWTGWQVSVTASNPSTWQLSTPNITTGSVQYKVSGGAGSGTLTFSDGTTTLTLNVTESSGGSCALTPSLSLSRSSMSFVPGGGSGQQDPADYSVVITSNTNWTASCSNAGGEALTFYIGNGGQAGSCVTPLSGTGNQTINVDLGYNRGATPLSSSLNVTTCGGSAAQSANMTINQGAQTFTVAPATQSIYQDYDNAAIQFTAYLDGSTTYPNGYSVSWSLSDPSGNSGTISSSGLYIPPNPVPTNFGTVTVIATLNQGGYTATGAVSVLSNPYAPQAYVIPNSQTGSGTTFQFEFNTLGANDPPSTAEIQNATMVFSTTATSGNQTPSLTGCYMYIKPGYGVYDSEFDLGAQSAFVETTEPGGTWSPSVLSNADCSVNLQGTETTLYTWATTGTPPVNTSPLFANIPMQFYKGDVGTTGIWATAVENGNTTTYNQFLGTYTVTAPTETVSPASVTLNTSGQTQQFGAVAAGITPIPDAVWNTPSAGTINSSGLYTAPNPLTTSQTVSISGTRQSDGTSICCATVVLSPVSVVVSPQSVSLSASQTQTITVTVNGTSNQSITWNTPSAGTFSNGVYTAPSSIASQQTATLTATSAVDPTKTASVTITLLPVAVSLSPTSSSLEINQTQSFTATVTGTNAQTVTWTLTPSGSASGSVSATGLYTAPASIPSAKTVTITATSTVDSTKSADAQITLIPDSLAISPSGATLTQGQSQQFTGTVTGTTNTSVNWSMNPSVGTLSSGGYYTAPSSVTTPQTIVITATSQANASLSGSVNVTLNPPITLTESAGTPQSVAINTAFATPLQVTVKNTSNNPVSGVTITFTAPSSGASGAFGGSTTATATTNSSGVATAPTLTANTIVGSYSTTASAVGAIASASFSLTNTPGPPASIVATAGTPQSATVGTGFATNLQATVKDSSGNLVSGATVTFTAPSSGASGLFGGSTTATASTNSNGVATAPSLTASTTVGAYSVTASVSGVATAASFSLTNNAGSPASITATAGTAQTANISTTFATALQATVKDSGGNLVSGATVTFTAPSSGASATFGGSTTAAVTTNSSGIATAPTLTANTSVGSYTVTVSVSGVTTSASFSLTNHIGAPASITASAGTPQSAMISAAFGTALQATVKDSGGNLVSGATVTFTSPSGGASATFSGSTTATATTNSSGIAISPTPTANATAGSYAVTASVSGVSPSASFSLTNNVGAPASITASAGTPQSTNISTAFATVLQATVKDSGGNLVNGETVTFTAPSSGASATFSGSTTATATTNGSGVATAPALTANATAGSYAVTASVSGVGTAATFSLTNINPMPVTVVLTSGTTWTAPAGVTSIKVECVGGGGPGGLVQSLFTGYLLSAGGGGGGAYARRNAMAVTAGNNYTYSIGQGGSSSSGTNGGSTTFTGDGGVVCKGAGGGAGQASYAGSGTPGGAGGSISASVGDVTYAGGAGAAGNNPGEFGGGGGGSAGSSSAGNAGGGNLGGGGPYGGAAVTGGGPGGNGEQYSTGAGGSPSTGPGGGGGGAFTANTTTQYNGGNGANGQIKITYTP